MSYYECAYLIGQISADVEETYRWRERIRLHFEPNPMMSIIDPCNNSFNQGLLKTAKRTEDPQRLKVYRKFGTNLLVPKDKTYVKKSTMAIANLNPYDPAKPTIGTLFELAWYHDEPEKSVIGIFEGDWKKDVLCNHPFVRSTINTWVKTDEEACNLIEYFYLI